MKCHKIEKLTLYNRKVIFKNRLQKINLFQKYTLTSAKYLLKYASCEVSRFVKNTRYQNFYTRLINIIHTILVINLEPTSKNS